ncbi:MAG TPA: hypothetical protein VF614_14355 [Chthoniobacteraceae bacterium]
MSDSIYVACKRSLEQRTHRHHSFTDLRINDGQIRQQFGSSHLPEPKLQLRSSRRGAVLEVVGFHQSAQHWPVFLALSFLRAYEIGKGKQVVGIVLLI